MKFPLGQVVATPGVIASAAASGDSLFFAYLARHQSGDWRDLGAEDRYENEYALAHDLRILSAYKLSNGTRIWIISEADRSSTCILLPDEY